MAVRLEGVWLGKHAEIIEDKKEKAVKLL